MLNNIKKIIINFKIYKNFLSLKKEKDFLQIKGFFGKIFLKIPENIIIRVDDDFIFLYFYNEESKKLKYFYTIIVFSLISVLFNHFVNVSIKGIGFKFDFLKKDNNLLVFNGNRLPIIFKIPYGINILMNENFVNISIFGCDFVLLNNFVNNIKKMSISSKYKKIGIFLEPRL
jgi:ribosomal protein L6P/L9E